MKLKNLNKLNVNFKDENIYFLELKIGYFKKDFVIIFEELMSSLPYKEYVLKQLIMTLNKKGYKIIFTLDQPTAITEEQCYHLIERTKLYSDDDIKTAVLAGCMLNTCTLFSPKAYTFNQIIKRNKLHAEKLLVDYFNLIMIESKYTRQWFMDLEPCEDCLQNMIIRTGATNIVYITNHKDKWNTPEYLRLVETLKKDGIIKYRKDDDNE